MTEDWGRSGWRRIMGDLENQQRRRQETVELADGHWRRAVAVSYTHLDVYKRQPQHSVAGHRVHDTRRVHLADHVIAHIEVVDIARAVRRDALRSLDDRRGARYSVRAGVVCASARNAGNQLPSACQGTRQHQEKPEIPRQLSVSR